MTNREKLLHTAEYDTLLQMQYELELCRQHSETPCIMNALGENLVGLRCTKFNRKCNQCIAEWMNEEVNYGGIYDLRASGR